MRKIVETLKNKEQTGKKMYWLVENSAADLKQLFVIHKGRKVPLSSLSFEQFFNFVKNIKYRRDTAPVETIMRVKYIIKNRKKGMDCKKKAILIASWFYLHDVPFRFGTSSVRKDKHIHHVFPQFLHGQKWYNADATYSHFKIAEPKKVTAFEVLPTFAGAPFLGAVGVVTAVVGAVAGITKAIIAGVRGKRARQQQIIQDWGTQKDNAFSIAKKRSQTKKLIAFGAAIAIGSLIL
jgi:hypothetical protein